MRRGLPLRSNSKKFVVTLALCFAALPVWAAKADSMDWDAQQTYTFGSTEINPGQYQLKAEEGKMELQVLSKGKVVATVPCHWVDLKTKAAESQVASEGGKVTQVQFAGHSSAVQLN
jgi:hypothetical protein